MKASEVMPMPSAKPEEFSRRKFLVATAVGALALAIVEAARISLAFLKPPPTEGFGGVFIAGPLADFPPGSVTGIRQGRFYLVHNGDGLLALYQRCTHLGCLVPWEEEENHFACPCHAGRYNREGEVISGPPPKPLDLFQLEIVDGEVVVDTSQLITRERYEPSQAVKG